MKRRQKRIELTLEVVVPADADPTEIAEAFIAAWDAAVAKQPRLRKLFLDATTPEAREV